MVRDNRTLSAKSTIVLAQIAEGRTYDQILARHPELTHLDIFAAAREDSRWNRTKGLVKDKTGAVSFEVLKQLLVSLAKEQLGL